MRHKRFALFGLALATMLGWPTPALAGMPSPTLTDWAELRVETISFYLLVFLLMAAVVRLLWNALAADFPALPRLTYRKALAGLMLVSLALAVVLTMIAGARELLTPGAWQKNGLLYRVQQQKPAEPPSQPRDEARQP